MFKTRRTGEPEDLATILSRDNSTGHIVMRNTPLVLYRRSFVFRGAMLWNRLPPDLRGEVKISNFKKAVKNWDAEHVQRL